MVRILGGGLTGNTDISTPSLREALRAHTDAEHQALHRHAAFDGLFRGTLDVAGYRALMIRLYGFYTPLDRAIMETPAGRPAPDSGYRYAPRAPLLAQDMQALGAPGGTPPLCPGARALVTPDTIGGVLYVLEGATMGGAQIDRATHRLLGHDDPAGRTYWAWCRAEGKHRWPLTLRHLDHLQSTGTPLPPLLHGALGTFRLLADWLAPLDLPAPIPQARRA